MSEFKGTIGNWRYSSEHSQVTTSEKGIVEGSKKICDISEYNKSFEEFEANAKLIAAAPELLEALEELLHLHSCEQEGIASGQPSFDDWIKATEKGNEAIQKALN